MKPRKSTLNEELRTIKKSFDFFGIPNRPNIILEQGGKGLSVLGLGAKSIDNLTKAGIDTAADLSKLSDEFVTLTGKQNPTMDDFLKIVSDSLKKNSNELSDTEIQAFVKKNTDLYNSILKKASDEATRIVDELMKNMSLKTLFDDAGATQVYDNLKTLVGFTPTKSNVNSLEKYLDEHIVFVKKLLDDNPGNKELDEMVKQLSGKKMDITKFKETPINLDPTDGGKLDINKPQNTNVTKNNDSNIIEPFKPRNYEWIYGGDLKNHIGEFKSDWIGEDAIDYSKLEGKYDKYVDYGEEFPEDIIYEKLINDIRYGFYSLKNGNTYDTWNQFPIGGFEKYGIDDFRSWVKNLYETNRLTNIEIDKDGVPFQFKIESESKVVQPAVLYGELPKSNFDEKMAWDLKKIADDPNLTPDEKYKKTLEKTNYYWRMKNINRGVKKIQDKKGAEFVLDDNGNFVLDPDYKPKPWEQDPDLNESVIKEINKIKKLL